jgi:hypothetical protein
MKEGLKDQRLSQEKWRLDDSSRQIGASRQDSLPALG